MVFLKSDSVGSQTESLNWVYVSERNLWLAGLKRGWPAFSKLSFDFQDEFGFLFDFLLLMSLYLS